MAWRNKEGTTVYLTKLELPLQSRKAAGLLTDCQNMHRWISTLFEAERQAQHVLYRTNMLRGKIQIYLYSDIPPKYIPAEAQVAGQRDLGAWLDGMEAGSVWGFDLLAMPSKKAYQAERGKNSQRRLLRHPEERMEWLRRKGQEYGFWVLQAEELEQRHMRGRHRQERGGSMYLEAYHYRGILKIQQTDNFRKALTTGIGPGKAYGLGMILLQKQ